MSSSEKVSIQLVSIETGRRSGVFLMDLAEACKVFKEIDEAEHEKQAVLILLQHETDPVSGEEKLSFSTRPMISVKTFIEIVEEMISQEEAANV